VRFDVWLVSYRNPFSNVLELTNSATVIAAPRL
jgi:hypothetical protein